MTYNIVMLNALLDMGIDVDDAIDLAKHEAASDPVEPEVKPTHGDRFVWIG